MNSTDVRTDVRTNKVERMPKFMPFCSREAVFGISVGLGVLLAGTCLAQHSSSIAQPGVNYAPSQLVSPTVMQHEISSQTMPISGSSTWIAPASVSSVSSLSTRNWALDIANAQLNLDPNRLPDMGIAKQRIDQSMVELENFLATSPQHQANWLAFLTWNDLRSELAKKTPDQDILVQIEKTFRQNYFGLEMRQFTNVRDSLTNYTHALKFSTDRPKTLEIFSNRLKNLSEQLQIPNTVKNFEHTREIGQTISYLMQGNQANDLVNAVLGKYSRSNARVLISSEFVHKRLARPVNESSPVYEVILGTQIYGQGRLEGWVTPQLLDSNTHAALRLNLNGSFSSQNIGYNRSVKLHTQGYGNVVASETIALTDGGLMALNDTATDATLSSQIDDIEARLRIVRRIASKQAAKQKPEADAIAEGRLENRIRTQFHDQLTQQLSDANQRIKTPDLVVLARLGLERPKRTTWSSPQYLALLWKLQDKSQLAAPASCPLVVDPTGITVQLHESAITNLLDPVLAGRILKSSELNSMAGQFGDSFGKGLAQQKDEEPWAVAMANYHPVEIELDDSLVTFRIRTNKLDRGGQSLDQPSSIEASYKITLNNGAIQLERQGDVKIDFSGRQQRGARAVMLRSFLKKKFEEIFKEKLLDQPIRITDRLSNELQGLYLSSIQVDDGWIQAHIR